MLFPMGGSSGPSDSPTEYALRMRKWAICLWALQVALLISRFVVLDFMGGITMLLVVIVGYFVPFGTPGMSQRWIICWGFLCALNAIVDLVMAIIRTIEYANGVPVGAHGHFGGDPTPHGIDKEGGKEEPKLTPMEEYALKVALFAVIVAFLVPLVEMLTAWLCYALFKDHKENAPDYESQQGFYGGQTYNDFNYGGAGGGGGGGGGSVYSQGNRGGYGGGNRGGGERFQPFQGGGQRLGQGA